MVSVSRGETRVSINIDISIVFIQDLQTANFEIILTLEGTTPETGNNIQVWF